MGGVRRALRSLGWGRSSGRDDQAQPVWLLRGDARHEPLHGHGGDQVSRAGERRLAAALRPTSRSRRSARAAAALAAPMKLADRTLWLGVAGRSPAEPFDDADRVLLEALASVGAIALANAELYAEVRQHREKLSVITRSLGEGVCAVSADGRVTFMNPAGASMLGWYGLETDDDGPVRAGGGDAASSSSPPCGRSLCDATSPVTTPVFNVSTGRISP